MDFLSNLSSKDSIRVEYDIRIIRACELGKQLEGTTIFVEWSRGSSKKAKGTSKRALVSKKREAVWNEEFKFQATLKKSSKKVEDKSLTFKLCEDIIKKKTESKEFAKLSLNLAKYTLMKPGIFKPETVQLKLKKSSAFLEISVQSRWLRLNNKSVVPKNDEMGPNAEYEFHTESGSDQTAETQSVVEEDFSDNLSEVLSEHLSDVTPDQSNELNELKKQLIQIRQEKEQQLKMITQLNQDKKDLLSTIELLNKKKSSSNSLHDNPSEKLLQRLDELKRQLAEKEQEVTSLKGEIFKLSSSTQSLEKINQLTKDKELLERELKQLKQSLENSSHTSSDFVNEQNLLMTSIYAADPLYQENVSASARSLWAFLIKEKIFISSRSTFLQTLTHAILKQVSKYEGNIEMLGYWMSTCIALLVMYRDEKLPASTNNNNEDLSSKFENDLKKALTKLFFRLHTTIFDSLGHLDPLRLETRFICDKLNKSVKELRSHHLPDRILSLTINAVIYMINAVLFNLILRQPLYCTCENGFLMKLRLSQLENFLITKGALLQEARDKLAHVHEAATLLTMPQAFTDHELLAKVCPTLSSNQVHRLAANFSPDHLFSRALPDDPKIKQVDMNDKDLFLSEDLKKEPFQTSWLSKLTLQKLMML